MRRLVGSRAALGALLRDEEGAVLAEYGLILGFFTVIGFVGFMLVLKTLVTVYPTIAAALGNSATVVPTTVTPFFP